MTYLLILILLTKIIRRLIKNKLIRLWNFVNILIFIKIQYYSNMTKSWNYQLK
jgi:hypothetical protein